MQSKMTEREARERLSEAAGFAPKGEYAERVLAWAREAGLEFAPEPVKLPERLVYRAEVMNNHMGGVTPEGGFFGNPAQREATDRLAVDRYNAYPGLRAAAEALHAEMVKLWPNPSTYGLHLIACLRAVEAELAKGPKP